MTSLYGRWYPTSIQTLNVYITSLKDLKMFGYFYEGPFHWIFSCFVFPIDIPAITLAPILSKRILKAIIERPLVITSSNSITYLSLKKSSSKCNVGLPVPPKCLGVASSTICICSKEFIIPVNSVSLFENSLYRASLFALLAAGMHTNTSLYISLPKVDDKSCEILGNKFSKALLCS